MQPLASSLKARRSVLRAGILAPFGISIADYLGLRQAVGAAAPVRAKSVILFYGMGGISHHDTFDPKPDAPAEIRGEFGTIATRTPGIRFSDQIPLMAADSDKFAIIRSVRHSEICHGVGAYYMLRGHTQPDPSFDRPENQLRAHPNMGSHVARLRGSSNGLPPFICVPGLSYLANINYYTAGWMGRAYDPYVLRSDPNEPAYCVRGLAIEDEIADERMHARIGLARTLGDVRTTLDTSAPTETLAKNYDQAYSLLTSGRARRAFDITAETDAARDAYGRTRLGQSCLLARRLVKGASDAQGANPATSPVSPKDLAATIYRLLGIDPFGEYHARDGRPMRMLDEGAAIAELMG